MCCFDIFGLKFGFLAKNNVGLCPPDLKRPTGGDFSSIQINFDESCTNHRGWNTLEICLVARTGVCEKMSPPENRRQGVL